MTPIDAPAHPGSGTDLAVDEHGNRDVDKAAGKTGSALSGNGRYILFAAQASSNLAPAEIAAPDSSVLYLLRKDLVTGEIVVASRDLDGRTPIPVRARPFAINEHGNAFAYHAAGEDESGNPVHKGLFIHHRNTGSTQNASFGVPGNVEQPDRPVLSDDGNVVTFSSWDQPNSRFRIYRYVAGAGAEPIDRCEVDDCQYFKEFDMSDDGDRVAYSTTAACGEGDTKPTVHVYQASNSTWTDMLGCRVNSSSLGVPTLSGDGQHLIASYSSRDFKEVNGVTRTQIGSGPVTPDHYIWQWEYDFDDQRHMVPDSSNGSGATLVTRGRAKADAPRNGTGYVHRTDRSGTALDAFPGQPHTGPRETGISDTGSLVIWKQRACQGNVCSPVYGVWGWRP